MPREIMYVSFRFEENLHFFGVSGGSDDDHHMRTQPKRHFLFYCVLREIMGQLMLVLLRSPRATLQPFYDQTADVVVSATSCNHSLLNLLSVPIGMVLIHFGSLLLTTTTASAREALVVSLPQLFLDTRAKKK